MGGGNSGSTQTLKFSKSNPTGCTEAKIGQKLSRGHVQLVITLQKSQSHPTNNQKYPLRLVLCRGALRKRRYIVENEPKLLLLLAIQAVKVRLHKFSLDACSNAPT